MTRKEFYDECGGILDAHTYIVPYHGSNRINRWTNRNPGNGRYDGIIIRYFSKRLIHILIENPSKSYVLTSPEEAFDVIKSFK